MTAELPQARQLADLVVRSLEQLGGTAHRSAITAKALELGQFSAAQRAEPTHSVSKRRSYPTELHYRLSWAITHAHNNRDIERVERSVWRLATGVVGRRAESRVARDAALRIIAPAAQSGRCTSCLR